VPHIRGRIGRSRGRVEGVSGRWWAQVNFQTQWDQLCPKRAVHGPQTTLQGITGCLITVMHDWEQPHTNATLLKPAKHCHSLFRALQGHEKAIWKSIPGYSIVESG